MPSPEYLLDIPTPALIVDAPAMERNIRRMADFFAARRCRLRPHFKAHKTAEIARRQLAAGSCTGLTCATLLEAEAVAPFCRDILIANEIAGRERAARVAELARHGTVTTAVDSAYGVEILSHAGEAAGATIGVLVDVNVGQNRCGVAPAPSGEAVTLARRVVAAPNLRLRGVMGYEGHAVGLVSRDERRAEAERSMQKLLATARACQQAGLPAEIVSSGGTGTYDISGVMDGITEMQAGSYALMDTDYGKLDLPFEYALFVMGTVISRPVPERCVADCGHKACTKDHGHPLVRGIDGAAVTALNDEHAVISLPAAAQVALGDRIFLIPSHTDPTLNLHDVVYALDGERVAGVWPVARGYSDRRRA